MHANLLIVSVTSFVGTFLPIINFETQMDVTGCMLVTANIGLAILCLMYEEKNILLQLGFYLAQGVSGFNFAACLLPQLRSLFQLGEGQDQSQQHEMTALALSPVSFGFLVAAGISKLLFNF